MFEKIKSIFNSKEKKIENLIFLLIILIITLLAMNSILKEEKKEDKNSNLEGAELAMADDVSSSLEKRIESILSKIAGVGDVSVLLTYAEDSLEGTVVVSQGAEDTRVKANIVNAIEAVTGLGKHKIQVYPMKK